MDLRAVLPVLLALSLLAAGCVEAPPDDGNGDEPAPPGELEWRAPVAASAGCTDPNTVALERPQPVVTLETTLGDIELEVFLDMVPITAQNFLDLVEDGFYDGTRFHRIIRNFMMQGGDPLTKDPPGAQAVRIVDEFHHRLRHDAAGILSMANAGPNTGSSQFFITFGPTLHLDDKHSVFGRVAGGMDVVERVNAEVASSTGTPNTELVLERATVTYPDPPAPQAPSIGLWTPKTNLRAGTGAGSTSILAVAVSCSDALVPVTLMMTTPTGVMAHVEPGFEDFELPAAQRVAFTVKLEVDAAAPGTQPVSLVLLGPGGAEARLEFDLERDPAAGGNAARRGDTVTAHYLGMLVDGRMFDTSYREVANHPGASKAPSWSDRPRGDTFPFTPGQGVIEGFTQLAVGMEQGTTSAGRIAPEDAYGAGGGHALGGKSLIFLLEAVQIDLA